MTIKMELRVRLLELTRPSVTCPDLNMWIEHARRLEAYVAPPSDTPLAVPKPRGRPRKYPRPDA